MTRRTFSSIVFVLGAVIVVLMLARSTKDRSGLSAESAYQSISRDTSIVVLDVRTDREYKSESGHLSRAVLIPLHDLEDRIDELTPYKGRKIIAYCRSGNRSGRAASLLREKGFDVVNLEGGIVRWNELKLPVVREDSVENSSERQP